MLNCREAGPGAAVCDQCAAGKPDLCRYVLREKSIPLRLVFRPLLLSGMLGFDAQGRLVYLIDSEQPDREKTIAIWHENIHALLLAAGVPSEKHDEVVIDDMAKRLADACPEILGMLRPDAKPGLMNWGGEPNSILHR